MKVSFIVPIYNVEKYLRRCLDSILGQTFNDWEAVCVNDGSKDACGEILKEYAARDERIVVVEQENGGLSDARNVGMAAAKGEFVVFVDSDDYIHPQTLEIAFSILGRSGADIVSWYKDTSYRNTLIIRHFLHLDTISYKPSTYSRRYDASSVKYDFTQDVFSVATELTRQKEIVKPIKHCYVWRHLIRKDLLDGIKFEQGLLFEDFPWWCAVMLKNPKIAYTDLPLYFYYFNAESIDVATIRGKKVASWVKGMEITFNAYVFKANAHQMERWSRNFKWPVLCKHVARFLPSIKADNPFAKQIADALSRLSSSGAFSNPVTSKEIKAVQAINDFIGL